MYKMIAIDVDDTLMNDEGVITKPTREALAEAMEHGVIVTLATGRMYASAKQIAETLGLNVPLITYQGSLVKNALDEKVLYERALPASAAQAVSDYCREHGLHLQTYCNDRFYAQAENEKTLAYSKLAKVSCTIEPDWSKLLSAPQTKMLIYENPETLERHEPVLKRLAGDCAHVTKSKPYFLEVMHREGNKGHAITFLARHFGCDLSEVIAVGDGWNDREMLEVAGLGAAMGNAVEPLKQIADYVTLSNNEDGVKHVIDKFIFQRI